MVVAICGLAAGGVFWWIDADAKADLAWTLATLPVLTALLLQIVTSLRRGDIGLDIVAALSMSAALAFGQALAGNVVALMYAGGQMLEAFAEGRARREMTALLGRVAFSAMRYCAGGLEEVPIEAIRQGDRLLIRKGEVVPVDGHVANGVAILDLSALTGESVPKTLARGADVLSGSMLVGSPFDLIASRSASDSTYAGIVRLVEAAQASKSPMARIADRYALGFLMLDSSACLSCVVVERRGGQCPGRSGCGDALPAYSGRSCRHHLRHVESGQGRRTGEGRRGTGGLGARTYGHSRQNRHAELKGGQA